MRRNCDRCDTGYEAQRPSSRYCSDTCRKMAAKDRKRYPQPRAAALTAVVDDSPSTTILDAIVAALSSRVLDSPRGRIATKLARDVDASLPGTPGYSGLVRELRTLLDDLDAPAEVKPANPLTLIRERHAGQRASG